MVIFRILSVITSVEAASGLFFTAMAMIVFPFVRTALENRVAHPYVNPGLVFYLMALVNVAFDATMAVASVHLWKLQRRGLFLLAWTLVAEVVYFMAILSIEVVGGVIRANVALLTGDRGPIEGTLGAMMGVADVSLVIQFITAFPIVAGVLIFFAYRYLRIPTSPLQ